MSKSVPIKLDEYEQEIEDNIETAREYSPQEKMEKMRILKEAAATYKCQKLARLDIDVFEEDLKKIKGIAKEEGLSYKMFLTNMIHKIATGQYKELHKY